MTTFVKKYVTGCDMCQQMKNRPQQPFGPLVPNKVPNRPWEIIFTDLITQLPESNGYNAICVIVDRLTKRAYFIPINNRFSSKDMAQLLYDKVYPLHGLSLQIILDREVQYSAELFQEWCKILGIESTMSIAYHSQTDGQMERVNQALEQYLRCYVNYNLSNWSDLLPSAEFAYNNQAYKGIKKSPFYLEYGKHPRAGPILVKESLQRDLNDLTYKRHEALEQTKAALTLAVERMKWYYDKKVQSILFKVGDKVLLNLKDYQTMERALRPQYKGPFEIIEKLSLVTFQLRMPPRYRALHPVFHTSKLTQYSESTICGQKATPPPPTLIQGQEEWEVEKILDS